MWYVNFCDLSGSVFHAHSNQIWFSIYWSLISLMFRIDHRSNVRTFLIFSYVIHDLLIHRQLSLLCAKLIGWQWPRFAVLCRIIQPTLQVDAVAIKRHHIAKNRLLSKTFCQLLIQECLSILFFYKTLCSVKIDQ